MRVASPWAWISVGLLFAACSDEKADASVNEDINWQLGCESGKCGAGNDPRSPSYDPETPFIVKCGENGAFFELSIRDPGREKAGTTTEGEDIPVRTRSTLKITNITEGGGCDVELVERGLNDSAEIEYQAECGSGCELDVQGAQEGWDFVGELSCDGLTAFGNTATDAARYNLLQNNGDPIVIKVGNCD
jgi:hypothetical protein